MTFESGRGFVANSLQMQPSNSPVYRLMRPVTFEAKKVPEQLGRIVQTKALIFLVLSILLSTPDTKSSLNWKLLKMYDEYVINHFNENKDPATIPEDMFYLNDVCSVISWKLRALLQDK